MGMGEGLGSGNAVGEDIADGKLTLGGLVDEVVERAAGHVLGNDVGSAVVLAEVEDGDDVGVPPETGHRLRFAEDAATTEFIEAVGLDHRDGDLPLQAGVLRQVDLFAAPFAEEGADVVAAVDEGLVSYALVSLCLDAGLRLGEALDLRWQAILL